MIRLSIICPTTNRPTLSTALASVAQQLTMQDELIVVGCPDAQPVAELHGAYFLPMDNAGDWGGTERNEALDYAIGTHVLWLDDDDCYLPGALEVIRAAVEEEPTRCHVFRMIDQHGLTLPLSPEVAEGNIGGPMFVCPLEPLATLGRFTSRYEGDYDFIRTTLDQRGQPALFHDAVIYGARDYGRRAWERVQ